ncbi:hypothetical protein [Nocardia asteroides]|uniref:hypothetical protein n=1 Tax=Nocardia asteroides TaxID=1824 RepID=UPI001E4BF93D|nr:hypothetical protein [Nocardia asteroides]UGT60430.1 hypothetical protein LTT61_25070 [Nocardia asteroides]
MGPEIVVGLLIAWAAGRDRRLAPSGFTGEALDRAMDRVHAVVVARLGGSETVERLLVEAGTERGAVTGRTRADAVRTIADTIRADPAFAAALRAAAGSPAPLPAPGLRTRLLVQARTRPAVAAALVATAIVLVAGVIGLISGSDLPTTESAPPSSTATGPAGTGKAGPDALIGTWTPSDGTAPKIFTTNGGTCTGFGTAADCTLAIAPDPAGRYALVVRQSADSSHYGVEFVAADHLVVYDAGGSRLYELNRV